MKSRETLHGRECGFTLIEVLVAFSILSLSLSVLFAILSSGSRTTRVSAEYSQALVLAESKLDELGVTTALRSGHRYGRFDDTYRWELRLERRLREAAQLADEPDWRLLDVTLRVWWVSAGDEREVVVKSVRLGEKE